MPDSTKPEVPKTPPNRTLFQGFEWHTPSSPSEPHYTRLVSQLPSLAALGFSSLWLPPGCKAASPQGNGYDIYDLYDLGEFEQKGSRSTRWGSKQQLMELAAKAKDLGVELMWDAVLNHKAGADAKQSVRVVEMEWGDRNKVINEGEAREIEAWVGFEFGGREGKYSEVKYGKDHFNATDWDAKEGRHGLFRWEGKGWAQDVDGQDGNADFLMFANLDYGNPEVREDALRWGEWVTREVGLRGYRLDAVQHISQSFIRDWISRVRATSDSEIFIVGEFWDSRAHKLTEWLDRLGLECSLFDAPLLYNFARVSTATSADLRTVFDDSLVAARPDAAVLQVQNHDTQAGSTMSTHIEAWFKSIAYAFILLRDAGYPCVFYGDLYGTCGPHAEPPSCGGKVADLVLARTLYAYGQQDDYFEHPSPVGFVRRGTADRPAGLVCLVSNNGPGEKRMFVGREHWGERWTDLLGWTVGEVVIQEDGTGLFKCPGVSLAVWVNSAAQIKRIFPVALDVEH